MSVRLALIVPFFRVESSNQMRMAVHDSYDIRRRSVDLAVMNRSGARPRWIDGEVIASHHTAGRHVARPKKEAVGRLVAADADMVDAPTPWSQNM
jgi:hypothetical protein